MQDRLLSVVDKTHISLGDNAFRCIREGFDAEQLQRGNWDHLEDLIDFGLSASMRIDPQNFAAMFSQGK